MSCRLTPAVLSVVLPLALAGLGGNHQTFRTGQSLNVATSKGGLEHFVHIHEQPFEEAADQIKDRLARDCKLFAVTVEGEFLRARQRRGYTTVMARVGMAAGHVCRCITNDEFDIQPCLNREVGRYLKEAGKLSASMQEALDAALAKKLSASMSFLQPAPVARLKRLGMLIQSDVAIVDASCALFAEDVETACQSTGSSTIGLRSALVGVRSAAGGICRCKKDVECVGRMLGQFIGALQQLPAGRRRSKLAEATVTMLKVVQAPDGKVEDLERLLQ